MPPHYLQDYKVQVKNWDYGKSWEFGGKEDRSQGTDAQGTRKEIQAQ